MGGRRFQTCVRPYGDEDTKRRMLRDSEDFDFVDIADAVVPNIAMEDSAETTFSALDLKNSCSCALKYHKRQLPNPSSHLRL